jgi:hypothetical protein
LHHSSHFLSSAHNKVRFLEELVKYFRSVQLLQKFTLQILLGVLHEHERDGFRNHIDYFSLDDVEI